MIHRHFDGNLYIILDSLDNMYNLIAILPSADSKELYADFTKDIKKVVYKNDSKIKTFCFGVSPYLIKEFRTSVIYSIIDEKNEFGEYFSFSDFSIEKMSRGLQVSVDDCKSVFQFEYNSNVYVNPYLCISYLRSLKENGAKFSMNLSPRSLWMKCIFEENDLDILYKVLSGSSRCEFNMAVSMNKMCTLSKTENDCKLYYPLFVFGGFLSCKKEEREYSLSASNDSTKLLLKHHLDILFLKKFKFSIENSQDLITNFLARKFSKSCDILSDAVSS